MVNCSRSEKLAGDALEGALAVFYRWVNCFRPEKLAADALEGALAAL